MVVEQRLTAWKRDEVSWLVGYVLTLLILLFRCGGFDATRMSLGCISGTRRIITMIIRAKSSLGNA